MYITGNYLLYHFSYAKIVEYLILVMDTSETFRGLHEACVKPKILTKAVISLPFLPLQPQPLKSPCGITIPQSFYPCCFGTSFSSAWNILPLSYLLNSHPLRLSPAITFLPKAFSAHQTGLDDHLLCSLSPLCRR